MPIKRILFVCTGNTFRSWSADALLRKHLGELGVADVLVSSAGTNGGTGQTPDIEVADELAQHGVVEFPPYNTPVTRDMLEASDLVIVMADDHLAYLEDTFDFREGVLYEQVLMGERTSIPDIDEPVQGTPEEYDAAQRQVVRYLADHMSELWKHIDERYTIFSDFVTKRKTVNQGYDVVLLDETPHAAAFMSVAIPEHEDAHILVVPKKRYMHLHNVPPEVANELAAIVARVGRTLAAHYGGYNVLLNNGSDAGQFVFHVHFHVIPRTKGDGIEIEKWRTQKLSREEFLERNLALRDLITREQA